jgi:hypothetical protein
MNSILFSSPRGAAANLCPAESAAAPAGGLEILFSSTRGRRFALAPGYMLWPPPGAFPYIDGCHLR